MKKGSRSLEYLGSAIFSSLLIRDPLPATSARCFVACVGTRNYVVSRVSSPPRNGNQMYSSRRGSLELKRPKNSSRNRLTGISYDFINAGTTDHLNRLSQVSVRNHKRAFIKIPTELYFSFAITKLISLRIPRTSPYLLNNH